MFIYTKKNLFSELFLIASSSQFDRIRKSESKILKRQYNKPWFEGFNKAYFDTTWITNYKNPAGINICGVRGQTILLTYQITACTYFYAYALYFVLCAISLWVKVQFTSLFQCTEFIMSSLQVISTPNTSGNINKTLMDERGKCVRFVCTFATP